MTENSIETFNEDSEDTHVTSPCSREHLQPPKKEMSGALHFGYREEHCFYANQITNKFA